MCLPRYNVDSVVLASELQSCLTALVGKFQMNILYRIKICRMTCLIRLQKLFLASDQVSEIFF